MKAKLLFHAVVFFLFFLISLTINAQAGKDYFTIENYYKVKWGYADEFFFVESQSLSIAEESN